VGRRVSRFERKRKRALDRAFKKAHKRHIATGDATVAAKAYAKLGMAMPDDPRLPFFASLATYQLAQQLPEEKRDEAMRLSVRLMGNTIETAKVAGAGFQDGVADAEYNLGKFLLDQGKDDEAVEHFDRAIELRPNFVEALQNGANCHEELGHIELAQAYRERCLSVPATKAEAVYNRSFLRLTMGDYVRGWAEYEARWACPGFRHEYTQPWMREVPVWTDGNPLTLQGKRILLFAEQGFGDSLQFARYIPLLPKDEATYGLDIQPQLASFMRAWLPEHVAIHPRPQGVPTGAYDIAVSLMSLPYLFGGKIAPLPAPLPLPQKRPHPMGALRVGLSWAGSHTHKNDRNRSAPFDALRPLLEVPGIEWHSVQFGPREAECDDPRVIRLGDRPPDFLRSAEDVLSQLDLIISVDTAVVHLAGSLGLPTWVMLPLIPDFRWGYERSDSLWYPSVRVYRSTKWREWATVVDPVQRDLWALAQRKREAA
jgi:tetratricopeptide (TPR) repeat protein